MNPNSTGPKPELSPLPPTPVNPVPAAPPIPPPPLDHSHEIINVWYELHYLRNLISEIVVNATGSAGEALIKHFTPEKIEESRRVALALLQLKFPHMPISRAPDTFPVPAPNPQTPLVAVNKAIPESAS